MRRRLSVALAAWAFAGACHAQAWPSKPVRVIVPFAPGGPVDIIARIVGVKLNESLGQQFLVENRAGAGGNIGAAAAAKSGSDGYTVLMTSSAIAVNASLYPDPGYDAGRDFTPIHFRGAGLAVTAVLQGEPPIGCMAISGPLPQVKAGKLRALAVSSAKRIPALPDVPTFAEAGFPGVEDYTWVGVFLPAGTPATIVQKLNEAVNGAIRDPQVRERLAFSAFDPVGGPQSRAADYVKAEIVKWGQVVRATGAKPD